VGIEPPTTAAHTGTLTRQHQQDWKSSQVTDTSDFTGDLLLQTATEDRKKMKSYVIPVFIW